MLWISNVCYEFDNLKVSSNDVLKTRFFLCLNECSFKMLSILYNKLKI